MGHRPHLARERDLAQHDRFGRYRPFRQRRNQGRGHRKVRRRIAQPVPARHVQVHFGIGEAYAAARLQHRQQHRQTPAVPAHRRAPGGCPARQPHHQRLHLDQHRPGSLQCRKDRGPADRVVALGQEQRAGVRHLSQPCAFHREHADLVCPAEAVLHRPQDTILMAALPFEVQHRVDHVLQHAGTRDIAVLCDVPNEDQRRTPLLGEANQLQRARPHLAHRSRCALDQVRVHGLHRIDHQQRRRRPAAHGRQDVANAGDARQLHRRAA